MHHLNMVKKESLTQEDLKSCSFSVTSGSFVYVSEVILRMYALIRNYSLLIIQVKSCLLII